MGASPCHMAIIRMAMSPVKFKKSSCRHVDFKKVPCPLSLSFYIPCHMSLRPRKGHVAVSILRVHTPYLVSRCRVRSKLLSCTYHHSS